MKRSITLKQVGQWSLFAVLSLWGMLAFIIVIGEDNPEMPMSIWEFLVWKFMAFVNLIACIKVSEKFNKRGWLPDLEKYFGGENYGK